MATLESDAVRACREYHRGAGMFPGLGRRRQSLADFATEWYKERLCVALTRGQSDVINKLADPDTMVFEIAHDGQLPHLGIVRMVLKTHDLAMADGNAVTLYLVGNHYSPDMRPDNIHFGMPLRGVAPDHVRHPPKIRIGRANAHRPFRWLPPPAMEDLERLHEQLVGFVNHNVAHERKAGVAISAEKRNLVLARLRNLFTLLRAGAEDVQSLGDWMVRIQHDLLRLMIGQEADGILFLPMAELTGLLRDELAAIARDADAVVAIKKQVSANQSSVGETAFLRGETKSAFWLYCPSCMRRQRTDWPAGASVDFTCAVCRHHETIEESTFWRWSMPDIVAYEASVFQLGVDGWVAGSHAPYHPVVRRVFQRVFRRDPPPTFFLESVPIFRGLGDPPEGFRKTRLLRALLESEPNALASALRAPWDDHPRVESDILAPPP